jgi:hypothetical protein
MAQLQNKMYICEKKMHNCETHVLQLYIFWQYNGNYYYFSLFLSLLVSTLLRYPAMAVNEVVTSRAAAGHYLSRLRHVIFLLLLFSLAFNNPIRPQRCLSSTHSSKHHSTNILSNPVEWS